MVEPVIIESFDFACLGGIFRYEVFGFSGIVGKIVEFASGFEGEKFEVAGSDGPLPSGTAFRPEEVGVVAFGFAFDKRQEGFAVKGVVGFELA